MDSSVIKLLISITIFITTGESFKIIHENNNSIQYNASYSGYENMDSYNERVSSDVSNQKMPLLLLKLIVDIISYKETKVIYSNISKESAKGKVSMLIKVNLSEIWYFIKLLQKLFTLLSFDFSIRQNPGDYRIYW